MYCRRCGNKMGDMDRFCHACGAPAAYRETPSEPAGSAESNEEIIFNPPYKNPSNYSKSELRFAEEKSTGPDSAEENLKDGIDSGDAEEAGKNERKESDAAGTKETGKSGRSIESEFVWNIHEFPKAPRKTDDIEFNWNLDEYSSQDEKAKEAKSLEEVLFKEMEDDSRRLREKNIDRFFTFSRKNEEFQELLDREYERLRTRGGLMKGSVVEEAAPETEKEPVLHKKSEEPDVSMTELPEETTRIEPAVTDRETVAETEDTEQTQAGSQEEAGSKEEVAPLAEAASQAEAATLAETASQEEAVSQAEAGSQAEAASEQEAATGQAGEKPGEEPAEETASAGGEAALEAAVPEKQRIEPAEGSEESTEGIFEGQSTDEPEGPAEEEYKETDETEPPGESESEMAEELTEQVTERAHAWQEEPEPEALSRLLAFSHDKHDVSDDLEARIQEAFAAVEQEGEQKQKRNVWTILFTVIAVILAIEIAILGIRYYAPDSAAADAINNVQMKVVRTISVWVDGIKELFSGQDFGEGTIAQEEDGESGDSQTGDAGENKPDEGESGSGNGADLPDPNPAADKNALISSQLGNNVNIGQVKANDALAWQRGKDYGVEDVNNSKPIENNIWQNPENGEPVYYDRSIVGAIIAFDSQWIDYVNDGNKSVLDLLKKDGEAYRKAANFSGVGKIKEAFKLLEIGEIRQGAAGFYVWTHEEIQVTEGGRTKDKTYNWIYYLEPIDGKMKIVNYFRF